MTDENRFNTEQEAFWAGDFGDAYMERNQGEQAVAVNVALFARMLRGVRQLHSVLEMGANIGLNLQAIHQLLPRVQLQAVEINARACAVLRQQPWVAGVFEGGLLDYVPGSPADLVFTKGVLIHQPPDTLPAIYQRIAEASNRYVLIAEYYNPVPLALPYRGHVDRLWKRDFAGEFLDAQPDFQLVDYGFCYHRDTHWPQDDVTWFLLERSR